MPARSATSRGRGARPRLPDSSVETAVTRSTFSWSPRGTRAAQAWSRMCRRNSPAIVGTAKLVNGTPRSGSYLSAAITSPIEATWTRSSSGSLVCL
jgi:hypothetical protein